MTEHGLRTVIPQMSQTNCFEVLALTGIIIVVNDLTYVISTED